MLRWGTVWFVMVVADAQFRHSAACRIELDRMAKETLAANVKWSSSKAYAQLEVWSLANGEAVCTPEQVVTWRKEYLKRGRSA